MKTIWQQIMQRLKAYPHGSHKLLPPCSDERLKEVEAELGKMPASLVNMLREFSGGEFFLKNGPLLTIFGVTTIPPLSSIIWPEDWYIDKFTPAWRRSKNRTGDWVIAITNYGSLFVLDQNELVQEWDTSQNSWGQRDVKLDQWIESICHEGNAYLNE